MPLTHDQPAGAAGETPLPGPPVRTKTSTAVQAERRRIAQALHDTVSQTLTGSYLLALATVRKLEGDHSEAASDVARLAETLHQAVVELQEIARGLQPATEPEAD